MRQEAISLQNLLGFLFVLQMVALAYRSAYLYREQCCSACGFVTA